MRSRLGALLRRYFGDERGISAIVVALTIVALTGMAGMSLDLGYAYATRIKLQAAANAAALAGAYYIGSATDPVAVANYYGSGSGNYNARGNGPLATMVSGYPKLVCKSGFATKNGVPCVGSGGNYPAGGANVIQVKETSHSPTFFASIFGFSFIPVSAIATASAHGGAGKPLDIEVIVDTTGSMGSSDSSCGISGGTRIGCAEAGINTLLLAMSPSVAKVQLMAFPGFPNQTQANYDWACPKTGTPAITPYYTSGIVYTVTPSLSNTYQTSASTPTLNTSDDIVKAIGSNPSCSQGLQTPGGEGTYYAGAISAAQATLAADGDSATAYQQAMILLSDGEAGSTDNQVVSINVTNGGSGYNIAPTVTISAPTGTSNAVQATATAVMTGTGSSQTVSSITIKNAGGGYEYNTNGTVKPTVTLTTPTGKTGSGATATITLTSIPGINQCGQAVTAATNAKNAGTWIFVIAYGSSTSTSDCSTDYSPAISPCTALEDIATDVTDFFSDGSGGVTCPNATSVSDLKTAFAQIAAKITKVRLIPNDTT